MKLQVPPSLFPAHGSLHQISQLLEERLRIEEQYSRQLEGWYASARAVPPENPLFYLIKTLLDTTNEDFLNRRAQEASLRDKLVDINVAIESFDSIFDPIRNGGVALGRCEEQADQARIHAKACYIEWMSKTDETFSFRKTVLRQASSRKNVHQADVILRNHIDELNGARLFLKSRLSQASDSLPVHYQAVVERITRFVSSFAEQQQSVASMLNAGGAKLWHSAKSTSSSTLAGQFLELFSNEANSMKAEKAIYCALDEQGDSLPVQHHHPILAFPISQYSCPKECHLVVSLFEALQVQGVRGIYSVNKAFISKIVDNWGINLIQDQQSIQSLNAWECDYLVRHHLLPSLGTMIKREETSKYMLQYRPPGELSGPAKNKEVDEMILLAVALVHGHGQGKIPRAIIRYYRQDLGSAHPYIAKDWPYQNIKILANHYDDYVTLLSRVSVVRRPLEATAE